LRNGIFVSPAVGGTDIRHNVVQKNSFGIVVHTHQTLAGTMARVRENCVRNNNAHAVIQGMNVGVGIFSDSGLNNISIDNNYCLGNGFFCVLLAGGSQAAPGTPANNNNLQLSHNESVNDGPIALNNATNI